MKCSGLLLYVQDVPYSIPEPNRVSAVVFLSILGKYGDNN
jgi:hypothetical protein